MHYMILYLITVLLSYLMECVQSNRIYRDALNLGYKIDKRILKQRQKKYYKSYFDSRGKYLIPFANLLFVLYDTFNYNVNRDNQLYYLKALGALIPLDKDENEYINTKSIRVSHAISKEYTLNKEIEDITLKLEQLENTNSDSILERPCVSDMTSVDEMLKYMNKFRDLIETIVILKSKREELELEKEKVKKIIKKR